MCYPTCESPTVGFEGSAPVTNPMRRGMIITAQVGAGQGVGICSLCTAAQFRCKLKAKKLALEFFHPFNHRNTSLWLACPTAC